MSIQLQHTVTTNTVQTVVMTQASQTTASQKTVPLQHIAPNTPTVVAASVIKASQTSVHSVSVYCYYSGGTGHMSRDCNTLRRAKRLCYGCAGNGHFLLECPGRYSPQRKQRRPRRTASYSHQCGRRYSPVTSGYTSDPENITPS